MFHYRTQVITFAAGETGNEMSRPINLEHSSYDFLAVSIRNADTETETETFTLEEILAGIKRDEHQLILWNDETNTFEHVIYCLVKYLKYSETEGEKIAWTVHNKGKCTVLEGTRTELEVYRKILQREGLSVTVE